MHTKCRIEDGRESFALGQTTELALKTGKLIQGSGVTTAMKAWDEAVRALSPGYSRDDLRDLVQRVILVLLMKQDARHAALLGELETLFGKFPEPVRAAS